MPQGVAVVSILAVGRGRDGTPSAASPVVERPVPQVAALRDIQTSRLPPLAGALLLLSGVTHVAQLGVYPVEGHVVGAASFGVAYFSIGIFLVRRSGSALWWGAILPAIGGTLGIYRFVSLHSNPFSIFHVVIDVIVVPVCIYCLVRRRRSRAAA